jgi:hypothetical protein
MNSWISLRRPVPGAYSIDKYEVTDTRYQACVDAGGCTAPQDVNSKTCSPYYGTSTYTVTTTASRPARTHKDRRLESTVCCGADRGTTLSALCAPLTGASTSSPATGTIISGSGVLTRSDPDLLDFWKGGNAAIHRS